MNPQFLTLVFFFYGLSFFSMGLIIVLEGGRGSDPRLHHALRPLAAFGLIHGAHEWIEMFWNAGLLPGQTAAPLAWEAFRLAILSFSFLSLAEFGSSLLAPDERRRRLSLLVPLALVAIWAFGVFIIRGYFPIERGLWAAADVWTRYVLGIPSAVLASVGLVAQQRAFRRAGMAQFGRDSLWAAVAFAWYGLVGQLFTRQSALPPSTFINAELFFELFGFPVQLLRATSAVVAAIFVIRFLRAFEVERQAQIAALQAAQLREAQQREAMRGELLKQVVAAQEAERQRVGRELHDEIGQSLTAIGLGLRGVSTSLEKGSNQAGQNLRHLEGLVDESLDELRRLIADLRPSHLDDLGLLATLRWYAKRLNERGVLKARVEVHGEEKTLAAPVKIALFRVVQEALTNVIKHADTSNALVRLKFGGHSVEALVEDEGLGFDLDIVNMDKRPSWGLVGMRERTALLGGQFELTSRPGEGTRVWVSIPYDQLETPLITEIVDDNPVVHS